MPVGAWTRVGDAAQGSCRPGAAALHRYIIDRWGEGIGSFGCYNPNSRAGSGWSLHREGRAIDVAVGPQVKAKGDGIFRWAIDNADHLGLQEIQWYGQIWTSKRHGEGIRTDTSSARNLHFDHVHIGLADGWTFTVPPRSPDAPTAPAVDWAALWRYLAALQQDYNRKRFPMWLIRDARAGSGAVYVFDGITARHLDPETLKIQTDMMKNLGLPTNVYDQQQYLLDRLKSQGQLVGPATS